MITFIYGDLFASRAVALVNPVNCAGAMGTPPGRAFAGRFPQMLADYQSRCTHGEVRIGEVTAFRESGCVIVNLPTKRHWRDSGQLEEIDAGLHALRQLLIDERIPSIAIPALGGVGGPPWRDVEPRIAAALGDIPDIDIELYPPRTIQLARRRADSTTHHRKLALGHRLRCLPRRHLVGARLHRPDARAGGRGRGAHGRGYGARWARAYGIPVEVFPAPGAAPAPGRATPCMRGHSLTV